ncbi:MAG: sugar ABC transporter permease [Spirochaetaceae bacterium]
MITTINKKEISIAYLFLLPSLIGFLLFMLYPIVFSIYLSLSDWSFFSGFSGIKFIGLENFKKLADDYYLNAALTNNMLLSLLSVPISIFSALIIATFLNMNIRFRGAIRTLVFMPYIATLVAVAIVFGALYNPDFGPINMFLRSIGIDNPPRWLSDIKWALPSVAILWSWKHIGYMTVIFLAGLQNIPNMYYEAATIDGAGSFRKFTNITWPLVSPTTFFLTITGVMNSLKIFPEIKVLTDGGPGTATYTMVYHIYTEAFENYNMGYAAALALLFFVITMIITLIQWALQKRWVNY